MEITNNALQTVGVNNNVLFTETPICGSGTIIHRKGSGIVTLRGLTHQCRARFRVSFGANIAIPTGTTVTDATQSILAISLEGEAIPATQMITTNTSAATFNNVSTEVLIDVPAGCCVQIGVKNIGAQSVAVQNANLIVERVA